MAIKFKKAFSWLGPYPYNPWIIFAFFSMMYFSRFVPAIAEQPTGLPRWIAGLTILFWATVTGGLFAVIAILFTRHRFWRVNRLTYILEITLGQALLLAFFPVISMTMQSQLGVKYSAPAALTPSLFLGSLVLVLGVFAAMHHGERAVLNRLKAADNLVTKLEVDREILLSADEELRQQTARFLHDQVQSDLMVAGIKLKNAVALAPHEVKEMINRVISILEKTRTIDLKNLTHILAPNFEANGIEQALNELVNTYKAEMQICITVNDQSEEIDNKTKLAIFRITEQALLNSLVHGPAKIVTVSLVTDPKGVTVLTVTDDGPGAPPEPTQAGVGTAVIDAWASTLMAKKFVETVPGYGYQLKLEIPRAD